MIYYLFFAFFILAATPAHADLAFVANVDGNWDLFTVDESGSRLARLTQTPYDEKDPAWSPDRQQIVFLTSDGQLNVIRVASSDVSKVTAGSNGLRKYSPVFSPDRKNITYAQSRSGANDDSDLMDFEIESGVDKIVLDQHAIQMWPSYSPDGKMLIYANLHCNESCGRFIQELWVHSLAGRWAKQLLLTNSFCKQAIYSPDGKSIAFSSDMRDNFDIWTLSLDDMQLQQLTFDSGMDESPAWSPDGSKIAFVSNRSGTSEIWVKDIERGDVKKLRPFGDKEVACRDVAW